MHWHSRGHKEAWVWGERIGAWLCTAVVGDNWWGGCCSGNGEEVELRTDWGVCFRRAYSQMEGQQEEAEAMLGFHPQIAEVRKAGKMIKQGGKLESKD